ncbi:MAG: ribosome maturation factor RimM [Clostridiales bacterium]|nr:ribosome maturation factor RimM [Clostridiales bacterium]
MKDSYLEVGKIVNTHGVRGEVKVESWCDEPEDLCQLEQLFMGGRPFRVLHSRLHGAFVLLTLEGVDSIDTALPLKGKVVQAERAQFELAEGVHFVVDLIGLEARHAETGETLGRVVDILEYPAQDIYVVQGEKRYLIPDVPDFVRGIFEEEGYILFAPLEGMEL